MKNNDWYINQYNDWKKSNKSQNVIDVTTNDIEVLNLETNEKEDSDRFFPKNEITKDYILINENLENCFKQIETIIKNSKENSQNSISSVIR